MGTKSSKGSDTRRQGQGVEGFSVDTQRAEPTRSKTSGWHPGSGRAGARGCYTFKSRAGKESGKSRVKNSCGGQDPPPICPDGATGGCFHTSPLDSSTGQSLKEPKASALLEEPSSAWAGSPRPFTSTFLTQTACCSRCQRHGSCDRHPGVAASRINQHFGARAQTC